MSQYCYVIVNNAGNSWIIEASLDADEPRESNLRALPKLLGDGWVPIRETPMGGGTSPLAHSLVLLEKATVAPAARPKPGRPAKAK